MLTENYYSSCVLDLACGYDRWKLLKFMAETSDGNMLVQDIISFPVMHTDSFCVTCGHPLFNLNIVTWIFIRLLCIWRTGWIIIGILYDLIGLLQWIDAYVRKLISLRIFCYMNIGSRVHWNLMFLSNRRVLFLSFVKIYCLRIIYKRFKYLVSWIIINIFSMYFYSVV